MKDTTYEIRVCRQEDALLAFVCDLRGESVVGHSPLCETARKLWWYVDRYLLWETERFPSRRCPERERLREAVAELLQQLKEEA